MKTIKNIGILSIILYNLQFGDTENIISWSLNFGEGALK